eukprot:COSAG06_NODE_4424_length_4280_cov_6.770390_3_plen_177_part_00
MDDRYERAVRNNAFLAPLSDVKHDQFAKTGSEQEAALTKTRRCFSCRAPSAFVARRTCRPRRLSMLALQRLLCHAGPSMHPRRSLRWVRRTQTPLMSHFPRNGLSRACLGKPSFPISYTETEHKRAVLPAGGAGVRDWATYGTPNRMAKGSGKKTALFSPFIYKMHHFIKTGSGQT